MKEKKKNVFQQNPDEQYVGNIFGWKTSLIGLAVILFFVGLYFFAAQRNKQNNIKPSLNTEVENHYHKPDKDKK